MRESHHRTVEKLRHPTMAESLNLLFAGL